ncbi:three-helix bundle dimerization domain-containing protein [Rhodococcus sp. RD6.2]|uniref:three-helix bundle dimerization domain-containing protein n=1 Tax=Rhodococcus sp. RD6.2 TaxID=260936 RepID=UPI00346038A7
MRRLATTYPKKSLAEVSDAVTRARIHLDGKPIRDFVPLLVAASRRQRTVHHPADNLTEHPTPR